MDRSGQLQHALWFALTAVAIALVAVKLVTGLALGPLIAIGVLVFAFAFGLTLRIDRGASRRP